MLKQLEEFRKECKDEGFAAFVPHSKEVQEKYRCYGMIYAVGPDESGRTLSIEESQKFLFKMKSTGFEIVKQILLNIPDSIKITKLKLPLVSGAIFKPARLTYMTKDGQVAQYKGQRVSHMILLLLLNGVSDALSPFDTHLQKIQLYNDESFENKEMINKIFKKFSN